MTLMSTEILGESTGIGWYMSTDKIESSYQERRETIKLLRAQELKRG